MTQRRVFVDSLAEWPAKALFPLSETEAHYLKRVLRLAPGAQVSVVDGTGREGEGTLAQDEAGRLALRLDTCWQKAALPRLTVAVCAPKGARLGWLVEKLTELGVAHIDWLLSARSQPHSRAAQLSAPGRLTRLAEAAARQSGAVVVPGFGGPVALEAWLAGWATGNGPLFVCHPAGRPLVDCVPEPVGDSAVMVGPEGGLTEKEVDCAVAAGAMAVSLGPQILRVETAALVGAAQLLARCGPGAE